MVACIDHSEATAFVFTKHFHILNRIYRSLIERIMKLHNFLDRWVGITSLGGRCALRLSDGVRGVKWRWKALSSLTGDKMINSLRLHTALLHLYCQLPPRRWWSLFCWCVCPLTWRASCVRVWYMRRGKLIRPEKYCRRNFFLLFAGLDSNHAPWCLINFLHC